MSSHALWRCQGAGRGVEHAKQGHGRLAHVGQRQRRWGCRGVHRAWHCAAGRREGADDAEPSCMPAATLPPRGTWALGAPASASLSRSTGTQVRWTVCSSAGGAAPCSIGARRAWRLAGRPRPSRPLSILPGREWARRRRLGSPAEQRWHWGRARAHQWAVGG